MKRKDILLLMMLLILTLSFPPTSAVHQANENGYKGRVETDGFDNGYWLWSTVLMEA